MMMDIKHLGAYKTAIFLGVGCLLLGLVITAEWELHQNTYTSFLASLQQQATSPISGNDVQFMPDSRHEQGYEAIMDSPLFIEGRQPIVTSIQSSTASEQPLKLTGILLAPQGLLALLQDEKKTSYRLKEGDTVFGWKISTIKHDRIILSKNNQGKELALIEGNSPIIPPPPSLAEEYAIPSEMPPEEFQMPPTGE